MNRLKIGAFPQTFSHYGPDAEQLGETLLAARLEREGAEADGRQLQIDGGRTADAADRALADHALAAGKRMPGTPNADAFKADAIRAGARLRAAIVAEKAADDALHVALVAARQQAAASLDRALVEAAEAHTASIAALNRSRAHLLDAERERRYVDSIDGAADYEANPSGSASRPDHIWPLSPAARPSAYRHGNRLIHVGHGHVLDIDNGVAALRQEIDLVFLRPDNGQTGEASPDTPDSERQFGTRR